MLERRDTDKAALENTIIGNINDLVIPYLERVKKRTADKKSQGYLAVLENNLETEIKGLYVCDASVFPEALARPTVLTIIGLSKRLAKRLLAQEKEQTETLKAAEQAAG